LKLIFNLIFFFIFTSCSFEETGGGSGGSLINNGYTPGLEELSLSSTFELYSPSTMYGTDSNITILIENNNDSSEVILYTESNCSDELSSFSLVDGSNYLNINLSADGVYNYYYKLKRNELYSECSGDKVQYVLDTDPVNVTIDSLENTSIVNQSNINTYTISGTCNKENQSVILEIDGFTNFTTNDAICVNSTYTIEADLSNLIHGDVKNIKVRSSSLSGLSGESLVETINVDLESATITLNSPDNVSTVNESSLTISGSCNEENANINIEIETLNFNSTCLSGVWQETIDISTANDGYLITSIEIVDSSNNTYEVSDFLLKDTTPPSLSGLSDTINPVTSKIWNWSCSESNCLYRFVIDGNTNTTSLGSYNLKTNASTNTDGLRYLHIQVKDSFGNESAVFHYSVTIDSTGPSNPEYSMVNPLGDFYSIEDSISFNISNLVVGDYLLYYNDSDLCDTTPQMISITNTTESFSEVGLDENIHNFSFKVKDSLNRESDCIAFSYTRDLTNPLSTSFISLRSPLNNESSKDNTPELYGQIENEEGSSIKIYEEDTCSTELGDSLIENGAFNVVNISYPIDGTAVGLHHFYYKIIDQANNESSCFDSNLEYTLEASGLAYLPKIAMVGSNSPTAIISLEDNNNIKLNGVVLNSSASKSEIINVNVNQGDYLECSKACYPVTQGYGTAPWASEAYSGRLFTSYLNRYGEYKPKIYVASVEGNSFVEIIQDGNVIDSSLVDKNSIHEFTVTLTNNKPFLIKSTKNISAYFVSRSSNGESYTRDARVLTPASTSIIGLSGYITTTEDNTTVTYSNNKTVNAIDNDLDISEKISLEGTDQGKVGVYAVSDKPISLTQIADRNGINAAPSIPTSMMATNYGIPRNASYVSFLSLDVGTVEIYNPSGTLINTINLDRNSVQGPYQARYTLDSNLPSSPTSHPIPAGTTFVCSTLCMAIYDDIGSGADADETLMMGFIE
jgi:hypothetical protein